MLSNFTCHCDIKCKWSPAKFGMGLKHSSIAGEGCVFVQSIEKMHRNYNHGFDSEPMEINEIMLIIHVERRHICNPSFSCKPSRDKLGH